MDQAENHNINKEHKEEIHIRSNSKEEILKRSSDEIIAMAIRDVLIREREKREKQ